MKTNLIKIAVVILFTNGHLALSQGFVNLDFEWANVPDVPAGQYGANVSVTNGLPGWTAYIGGNQVSQISHNSQSLGGAAIIIQGPQWDDSSQILEGQYTLLLEGLQENPDQNDGNPVTAAVAQIGQIPVTAQSLEFFGYLLSVQVTFDGQTIPYAAIGSGPNYTIYAGDISGFAGQTGELRFTESYFGFGLLDNIQFSSDPVPEPTTFALAALGGLLLGFRRWTKLSSLSNG
jgi:hypothetical protein